MFRKNSFEGKLKLVTDVSANPDSIFVCVKSVEKTFFLYVFSFFRWFAVFRFSYLMTQNYQRFDESHLKLIQF